MVHYVAAGGQAGLALRAVSPGLLDRPVTTSFAPNGQDTNCRSSRHRPHGLPVSRRPRIPVRRLQCQHSLEPCIDTRHQSGGYLPDPAGKIVFVKGHDLGDFGDGVLRKTRASRWQMDVPGHVNEPQVRREDHAENSSGPVQAEVISLNDQDRSGKPGLGTARFIEARPPQIAPRDYRFPRRTLRWLPADSRSRERNLVV